jgi:CRP-like cAMP-binding protein
MFQLKQFVSSFHSLSEACVRDFEALVKSKQFERGEYLLKAGKVCEYLYFIEKGVVQCYKGSKFKKQTLWFMLEGEIPIYKNSFYGRKESEANIVALEDTRVYTLSYTDMRRLCEVHHSFALMALKITEDYHMRSDLKSEVLGFRKSEDRYYYLKEQRPDIVERVPQKDQASFLRITEETLSRTKRWPKMPPESDSDGEIGS